MNLIGAIVAVAPVGTTADDTDAWTTIGTVADVHFDTDGPTFGAGFPVRIMRFPAPVPWACLNARRDIEEYAERLRIGRLLTTALREPVLLPCPGPF
ncbi:hypothetical protein [Streptomyces sp. NPDC097619]|uniref:hypothetical protein n=1 Tax=Streptomyces sp. NPDC097619 TaxID=3157228 RepID=UPI003331D710